MFYRNFRYNLKKANIPVHVAQFDTVQEIHSPPFLLLPDEQVVPQLPLSNQWSFAQTKQLVAPASEHTEQFVVQAVQTPELSKVLFGKNIIIN